MSIRKDAVVMITGAARGMGYAIAERLAPDAGTIVMVDLLPEVEKSADEIARLGCRTVPIVGDISDEATAKQIVQRTEKECGALHILMNNAGISPKLNGRKPLVSETSVEEWDQVFAVNCRGLFLMCKETLPLMKRSGWGRIINTTSAAARASSHVPGSHYCASKAAVIGFSRILALEVGGFGITVNCIAPGRIDTEMADTTTTEGFNEAYLKLVPMGRIGRTGDVASVVEFLASDAAEFLTGTIIDINGGRFMP